MVAGKAAESFHYISVMAARVKWKKEGKRVHSRTRGTPEEYKRTQEEKPRMKLIVVSVCVTAVTDMAAVSLLVFEHQKNPEREEHQPPRLQSAVHMRQKAKLHRVYTART